MHHPQILQYQYLRAQQEALTAPRIPYHMAAAAAVVAGTRSPLLGIDPKLESQQQLEETRSPPLELRRDRRTPHERTTDSPQIAQVYMLGHGGTPPGRLPPGQYVQRGYGQYESPVSPLPAHLRSPYPLPVNDVQSSERDHSPDRNRKQQQQLVGTTTTTPPHASPQPAPDSLVILLRKYPLMWQGLLALKNDQAAVQMHFVFGSLQVARDSLPCNSDGSTPPLRIVQRMRLEQTQVEGVARKMQVNYYIISLLPKKVFYYTEPLIFLFNESIKKFFLD